MLPLPKFQPDGSILAWFKTEAERQGVPYQTLIGSILHRFAKGDLIDKSEVERLMKIGKIG